ncbi:MAG: VanZ family protein [Oscillospiraceae bacterium]|nr:VanZ family protein [Oscillospiraceae bacterium]
MRRTSKRMRLCITLLILNLLFIWGNSAMPGEISGCLSDWVKDILSLILPIKPPGTENDGFLLRKLAHFTEFACLGVCLCWLTGMLGQKGLRSILLPLLGGFAAACVDEMIQLFVEGRSSSLIDVGIDTLGVLTGIFILLAGYYVTKKIGG